MENGEATWKKATKCNKPFYWFLNSIIFTEELSSWDCKSMFWLIERLVECWNFQCTSFLADWCTKGYVYAQRRDLLNRFKLVYDPFGLVVNLGKDWKSNTKYFGVFVNCHPPSWFCDPKVCLWQIATWKSHYVSVKSENGKVTWNKVFQEEEIKTKLKLIKTE